jgi:hypothetical protein
MKLLCEFDSIISHRSGVNSSTNRSWEVRELLCSYVDSSNRSHAIVFTLFGSELFESISSSLVKGVSLDIDFEIDSREYNGRYYLSLRIVSISIVGSTSSSTTPHVNNSVDNVSSVSESSSSSSSDLPF